MDFQPIIKNRLGTEDATATQQHLDVLLSVQNRVPSVPLSQVNFETLKAIEERCVEQPFPHNIRIDDPASRLEDLVFYNRIKSNALPRNRWLRDWCVRHADGYAYTKPYAVFRSHLSFEDHTTFDLDCDFDTQATFLLLVANAVAENADPDTNEWLSCDPSSRTHLRRDGRGQRPGADQGEQPVRPGRHVP